MNKLAVTVQRHPSEGYGLTFAYAPRMVEAIKTRVPSSERRYDAVTKTWWLYRRADLDALRLATNGWATFVHTPASTMNGFREAQATVQARNAEARKRTFTCRHCAEEIAVAGYQWTHVASGQRWCGIETYATPAELP